MNLTLPAGGTSPPSSLDMECPQNCIRQQLAGATGLETAAAQLSDSLAWVSPHSYLRKLTCDSARSHRALVMARSFREPAKPHHRIDVRALNENSAPGFKAASKAGGKHLCHSAVPQLPRQYREHKKLAPSYDIARNITIQVVTLTSDFFGFEEIIRLSPEARLGFAAGLTSC
jgi:hypothetical protein